MQNTERRLNSLWMQTALAVAESGAPGPAAKRLGVNLTTVYRHLNALDRSLGVQVFDRRQTGWILREEAAVLVTAGKEIERLLSHAEAVIQDSVGVGSGILRIAVSEDFATHYVAPRLRAFREAHGGVHPDLVVSGAFSDLSLGEADVAIRPHMDPGDTLVGRRPGRMKHALYASRAYTERHGRPSSLSDASRHRFCAYGSQLEDYSAAQWLDAAIKPECVVAHFGSTSTMLRAVVEGLGIGMLPCFVADAISTLDPVMTVDGGLPVDIWLVTTAASRDRPTVRAFFKFFARAIRSDAALFTGVPYKK